MMKACFSFASVLVSFVLLAEQCVFANSFANKPILRGLAKQQSHQCLLLLKDTLTLSGSFETWVCELENHAKLDIEGIETVLRTYALENDDQEPKSGSTTLLVEDAVIDGYTLKISPDSKLTFGEDSRRRLATAIGEQRVLAVRVTTPTLTAHSNTFADTSDSIFGNAGDQVNLKSQYEGCSHGKVTIEPVEGPGIINGVIDIEVNANNDVGDLEGAAENYFWANILPDLESEWDLVMLCMPRDINWGGIAYAYINSWLSVYNDDWCTYPSVQLHELGHNFNLAHSGESGDQYGDVTGFMGYSSSIDDQKKCFNPAKSWQLQWYDDRYVTVNVQSDAWQGQIVGVGNDDPNVQSKPVVIKVPRNSGDDLYVGYNHRIGFHEDTGEARNQVTVVSKNGGEFSYGQSSLQSKLSTGDEYTINNFDGTGERLTIKVTAIDTGSQGYAYVKVYLGDESFSGSPSASPSAMPSASPTLSQQPTASPSNPPSAKPSVSAQPTVAPSLSLQPSANPTAPPSLSQQPSVGPTSAPSGQPSLAPSVSPSAMPTETPPDLTVIDYEDFENDNFGAYWRLSPNVKKVEIKDKYEDAIDPSIEKTFAVKFKEDAAMQTSSINTSTYTHIQVSFVVMFKKMDWNAGDKFSVQYSANNGASFQTLMTINKFQNTQFAVNNEKSWHNVTGLEVPVNDANEMIFKLSQDATDKGESHVDHVLLIGVVERTPSPSTAAPTDKPSASPSLSQQPSASPSNAPSAKPSSAPSESAKPSNMPSDSPTLSQQPTASPSLAPSRSPTLGPTASAKPSIMPTDSPTLSQQPTASPSNAPSRSPTLGPTASAKPSIMPSDSPTLSQQPTSGPTDEPSGKPSLAPSVSHSPSVSPSASPTVEIVLEAEVDYQDFENGSFGPYWKAVPWFKEAKISGTKYPDALDPSGISKTKAVKLKKKGAIYTEKAIQTAGYNTISLEFNVLFKKMDWNKGDKFLIEYRTNDSGSYTNLMEVKKGGQYAKNDEKNWSFIAENVPVGSATSMRFRLSMSGKKGEAYVDHLRLRGA